MKPCRPDCCCPLCDTEMATIMLMDTWQYAAYLTMRTARATGQTNLRVSHERGNGMPPPPDLNARIIAAAEAGRPRLDARDVARTAALRANMRRPAPPRDLTAAERADNYRALTVNPAPAAVSIAEQNRRLIEAQSRLRGRL